MFEPYYWYLMVKEDLEEVLSSFSEIDERQKAKLISEVRRGRSISVGDYGYILPQKSKDTPYYYLESCFCVINHEKLMAIPRAYRHFEPCIKERRKGYTRYVCDLSPLLHTIHDATGIKILVEEVGRALSSDIEGYYLKLEKNLELQIVFGFINDDSKVSFHNNGRICIDHKREHETYITVFLGMLYEKNPYYLQGDIHTVVKQYVEKLNELIESN